MKEDIEIQFRATKPLGQGLLGPFNVYVAIPVHFFISKVGQKRLFRDKFNYKYGPKFLQFKFTDADLGMIQKGKKLLEIDECFMVIKFYLDDKRHVCRLSDRETIAFDELFVWIDDNKWAETVRIEMDLRLYFENECSFGLPEIEDDPKTKFFGKFSINEVDYMLLIRHLIDYFRTKSWQLERNESITSNLSVQTACIDCTRALNFLKLLKVTNENYICDGEGSGFWRLPGEFHSTYQPSYLQKYLHR